MLMNVDKQDSYSFNNVKTFEDSMKIAKLIADSDFAPKDYKGKPANVLVAVQMGKELGLQPMQALQNIAVINGRPSVWGDALPALAMKNPDFEWMTEKEINGVAHCFVKRKGHEEHLVTYTVEDAKQAGLWGKQGPWTTNPKRMMKMRARAFALRDKFPDSIKGLLSREEAEDIREMKTVNKVESIKSLFKEQKQEIQKEENQIVEENNSENTVYQIYFETINGAQSVDDLMIIAQAIKEENSLTEVDKKNLRNVFNSKKQEIEECQE
jgi:RecT family